VFGSERIAEIRSARDVAAPATPEVVHALHPYASSRSKRAMDIVLGVVALVVLTPVLAVVALAVRVSSRGPVLFRQERVGRGGRHFTMLKFRTMRVGADDAAHRAYVRAMFNPGAQVEVAASGLHKLDDDRVTRVGAFLRRTSLDEIPQLVNVLTGSMSLVGPRPVLIWEVELFGAADHVRFQVKPGMTGLWQVSGRSKLPMTRALELDREYVARQGFLFDVKIILKTIPSVLLCGEAA
jgi:lipopolysaccharide/colanic/teichoic acid biosynthesis glycosyltransferase